MMRYIILLLMLGIYSITEAQELKDLFGKAKEVLTGEEISQEEAGKGLKQALELGVEEAVDFLAKEDGYFESPYKIFLPEEARKVTQRLRSVPGFEDAEQKLILRLNRAAEDAADKAKPIFVGAIKDMSFTDALDILMGKNDAATRYLERKTSEEIYAAFNPVIVNSLDKVNAREYWETLVDAYNKIPLVKKVNPDLDDHVTRKAMDGMFSLVEVKEKKIRTDVDQRGTELLRKVFARQD